MSRLDQLDSIPERVIDVEAAYVGQLVIETYLVTSGPKGITQGIEGFDHQRGVGLAGGPKVVLDPEVQRHPAVGEPTSPSGRERRRLQSLFQTQDSLVEVPGLELPARGHRQLDVVDSDKSVPHDPPPPGLGSFSGERLLGGCRRKAANLQLHMGSLIKKRRKRMRKKKHKKMLKATRWQRRAAGK
jgi:hypothetical protein